MSRKNPSYPCFGFFKEVYGEKRKRKQKKKKEKGKWGKKNDEEIKLLEDKQEYYVEVSTTG